MLQYLLAFVIAAIVNILLPKKYQLTILKCKSITKGSFVADALTIIEWKPLGSLKTIYIQPGSKKELHHTRLFSSFELILHGSYQVSIYNPSNGLKSNKQYGRFQLNYIPADCFQKLVNSTGCRVFMLTGPHSDTYSEYIPGDDLADEIHVKKIHSGKVLSKYRPLY